MFNPWAISFEHYWQVCLWLSLQFVTATNKIISYFICKDGFVFKSKYDQRHSSERIGFVLTIVFLVRFCVCFFLGVSNVEDLFQISVVFGDALKPLLLCYGKCLCSTVKE